MNRDTNTTILIDCGRLIGMTMGEQEEAVKNVLAICTDDNTTTENVVAIADGFDRYTIFRGAAIYAAMADAAERGEVVESKGDD